MSSPKRVKNNNLSFKNMLNEIDAEYSAIFKVNTFNMGLNSIYTERVPSRVNLRHH